MDVTTVIILGVLLILLYKYFLAPNRYWEKFGIPCADQTSFWHSVLEAFSTKFHEIDTESVRKYGRIYGFYVLGLPNVMISDPALIRDIMVKDFQNFRNTQDFAQITCKNDLVNHMMLFVRDEKWKRIRTITSPVFTTGKIKKVLPHLSQCITSLLKNFRNGAKTCKGVDVKKYYEAFSMDMIASVAFATKIDSHNDPQNVFVVNARKLFTADINWKFFIIVFCPKLIKLFSIPLMDVGATNFFKNVILKIIDERTQKNEKHNDFIQLMMDASDETAAVESNECSESSEIGAKQKSASKINKVLSPDELMANSMMFFVVAASTVSFTLSSVSYLLAVNPECQEKLIEEIDETLKNNEMELTYDAIQNMKYMDMVFSEALRLYPATIRIIREAEVDYVLKGTDLKIPKKALVNIPTYAIHHDPEFYPDPEKFDPNRFSPEECAKRDPYTYLPFSVGPRNCIGMRFALFAMKTSLAHVLTHYRFKRCAETTVPLDLKAKAQGIVTTDDITLLVEERNDRVIKD